MPPLACSKLRHEILTEESWSDCQLDDRLLEQLGDSKQACIKIVESVEERLQDIYGENNEFVAVVARERRV